MVAEVNLIDEATEAARTCFDMHKRSMLIHYTSELRDVFGRFVFSCSREDMSELVGAWTRVLLALNNLPSTNVTRHPILDLDSNTTKN